MGKEVDSGALLTLDRVLGIQGRGSGALQSQETQLDDDRLIQTIDTIPIIRRSRTPADTSGLFQCSMQNAHAAADDESSTQDPYNPVADSAAIIRQGYPDPIPPGFDFWVLQACIFRVVGAGALDAAWLRITSEAFGFGWSIDDEDNGLGGITTQPVLAQWEGMATTVFTGATPAGLVVGTGEVVARINMRIRRGVSLTFDSQAGALATFRMTLTCGVFPEGLGQDIVS